MNAMVALLLPAMLGVDFGWDRRADGTIEYIVQVDPDAFAEMQRSGQSISSALPSALRSKVSDVQFRVGRDKLPNQNTLPPDVPGIDALKGLSSMVTGSAASTVPTAPPDPFNSTPPGTTTSVPSSTAFSAGSASTAAPVPTPTPQYMTNGYQPSTISAPPPSGSSFAPNTNAGTATSGAWPSGSSSPAAFPANPTAAPSGTTSGFGPPTPTTIAGSSSGGAAWPSGATPPSLSTGPRVAVPQASPTAQRDPTILNRMPIDMNGNYNPNGQYQTAANPTAATGPVLGNPTVGSPVYGNANYGQAPQASNTGYAQPGYGQPTNGQPGYGQPANPQTMYAAGGQQPGTMQPGGQMQPGQMPNGGTMNTVANHDPYYGRPGEPRSASAGGIGTLPTSQADAQWVPLTLCLIGFLTSLASNFYFGWSTYQLRERYRLLLVDRGAY